NRQKRRVYTASWSTFFDFLHQDYWLDCVEIDSGPPIVLSRHKREGLLPRAMTPRIQPLRWFPPSEQRSFCAVPLVCFGRKIEEVSVQIRIQRRDLLRQERGPPRAQSAPAAAWRRLKQHKVRAKFSV